MWQKLCQSVLYCDQSRLWRNTELVFTCLHVSFLLYVFVMKMQVQNNLCTPKSGEILVASTQDFLTSSFLITRKDTFYNRASFSLICSYMGDAMDPTDLPSPAFIKVWLNLERVWTFTSVCCLIDEVLVFKQLSFLWSSFYSSMCSFHVSSLLDDWSDRYKALQAGEVFRQIFEKSISSNCTDSTFELQRLWRIN